MYSMVHKNCLFAQQLLYVCVGVGFFFSYAYDIKHVIKKVRIKFLSLTVIFQKAAFNPR